MIVRYRLVGGVAALATAAILAGGPLRAGQEVDIVEPNAENSLLGVHLLTSTFRDVLKKYGQPSEIQAGGPFAPTPPPAKAAAAGQGGMMGGRGGMGGMMGPGSGGMGGMMGPGSGGMGGKGGMGPGLGGSSGMGGSGGKKETSKNGFPSSNGGRGGMGPGSGGGMGPGSGGMGPGSGGMGPGGMSGGLPGFGPAGGSGGGPGGEGEGPGGQGLGTGNSNEDNPPVKETTWWYHDHQVGLHMAFVFNRVGQVIQIGEYGPKKLMKMHGVLVPNSGATRRGVVLGNSIGTVIGKYGWSLDGAHDADNVILRFGRTDKVAFQMVHNSILGITIGVTHSTRPAVIAAE